MRHVWQEKNEIAEDTWYKLMPVSADDNMSNFLREELSDILILFLLFYRKKNRFKLVRG